jgi:predicted nucleic acid-binding protein
MKKLRLYLETSVWNFYFADDSPDKKEITVDFFNNAAHYEIYISEIVLLEIEKAENAKKRDLLSLIAEKRPIMLELNQEILSLAGEYLTDGVIPENKREDAIHAAVASFYEIDALISWNYRHLANLIKSEKINGINIRNGYRKTIEIVTPMEVYYDES